MTTRGSQDLPPPREEEEAPLPANVREFPFIIPPDVVIEIWRRQREQAIAKAVARHESRKRRRRPSGASS